MFMLYTLSIGGQLLYPTSSHTEVRSSLLHSDDVTLLPAVALVEYPGVARGTAAIGCPLRFGWAGSTHEGSGQ